CKLKGRHGEKSLTEPPVADERGLSIATMKPTLRQQRLALAIIGLLFIGFAAIAPFAAKQAVQVGSFVPTVQAIIFVTNLTTAVLLFSQFSILGLRELLLLASGYLFSALIVIPHALSYPGAFAPKGLLGSGIQATPWLYTFWHFGFSAVVLGYACLLNTNSKKLFIHNSGMPAICLSTGIVVTLVSALTWSVAAKEEYWPRLLANDVDFTPLTNYVGTIPLATSVLAFIVLWFRRRSVLDLWVAVAILATVVEQAVACLFIVSRYSVGAFAVRTFSVIVSTIVLSAMLSEFVRVYASLVRTNQMLQRERESKLTTVAAAVAAIAHEIRQPLTAISANSSAARRFLARGPADIERVGGILDNIGKASLRANEIVEGVGALFRRANPERQSIDVNDLVIEALQVIAKELADCSITVDTQLTSELPRIMGDKGQLQEVIVNLVQNSIDAMRTVSAKPRMLHVRTEPHGRDAIAISVEDTGPGIEQKTLSSVFDAFVTTKTKGMGLGLAISQAIVERHDGRITAMSGVKSGARFEIILPIKG
ncbi:MAG: MASE4 domain-containing protein, partial [Pseudolabrys sp.]